MPTYGYICDACGHEFERFQSMKEKSVRKCPECEKPKVRRLITGGAGVLFKGSGFYQTDYRSKSYQEAAKKDSPNPTPSGGPSPAGGPKGPETSCKQPKVPSPDKKKP